MEEQELQQAPWYWRGVELVWGYTGTLAVVAVLGGTLGRGVVQMFNLHERPANLVCCTGLHNPAGPEPPQSLGVLGVGVKPAVAHVQLLQNAEGKTIEARHVNAEGELQAMPGSQVARQTVEYDDAGRVTRRVNRDAAGKLAEDAAGVAIREFDYDAAGRLVGTAYKGDDGRATAARPLGVAEQRCSYDAQGRPLVVQNLGANGVPVVDSSGEETLRFEYPDGIGVELRHNFVRGQATANYAGYAHQRIVRDESGKEQRREWFDAAGNPVENARVGAAAVVQQHYPQSRTRQSLLLAADGQNRRNNEGWSEHIVRSDAQGRPEWECFAGADGLPRDNGAAGYAEKVCTYGASGEKEFEYCWAADGTPAYMARKRYVHNSDGQPYCLILHADGGSTVAAVDNRTEEY